MIKTDLQSQALHNAKVRLTRANDTSTNHIVNKIMYDNLFMAVKEYPKPHLQGDETKLELLYKYNIHKAITINCLKKLQSFGNLNATELLKGIKHTIDIEDCQQQVLLTFCAYVNDWNIQNDGKVDFCNDNIIKLVFGTISTYLYQYQVKHYKHQYVELDNNIIDATKVTELAKYISIEDIYKDIDLDIFINKLAYNDRQWLLLRIDGLSNSNIAQILEVTYEKVRAIEKRVRKLWINQ